MTSLLSRRVGLGAFLWMAGLAFCPLPAMGEMVAVAQGLIFSLPEGWKVTWAATESLSGRANPLLSGDAPAQPQPDWLLWCARTTTPGRIAAISITRPERGLALSRGWQDRPPGSPSAPYPGGSDPRPNAPAGPPAYPPAHDPNRRPGQPIALPFPNATPQPGEAPATPGYADEESEILRLRLTVNALGYSVTDTQTRRIGEPYGFSQTGVPTSVPVMAVTLTGRNGEGDQRVFTSIAFGVRTPLRLFAFHAPGDTQSAQDVAAIQESIAANSRQFLAQYGGLVPPPTGGGLPAPYMPGSPVAGPSAPPSAESLQKTSQMVAEYAGALLMVAGKEGVGSGFLCAMGGKTYAFTNAHVISGNPGFKLTTLQSAQTLPGAAGVAVGHDILRMEAACASKPLEVAENFAGTVKIGDEVVVLGNSEGAMVVQPQEGRVVGIGPNLVEVDAAFVKGNSGSPIVHKASGKVIGVATYLVIRTADTTRDGSGNGRSAAPKIRRFGYRIDSVTQWEPVNWPLFFSQSAQVEKISQLSDDFLTLGRSSSNLSSSDFQSPAMQRAVREVETHRKDSAAHKALLEKFLKDLRYLSIGDVNTFKSHPAYDYFRREVDDQARFREAIYQNITRSLNNL